MVVEGVRLVEEVLTAGVTVRGVLVEASFGGEPRSADLLRHVADRGLPMQEISARELGDIADTKTPQGIVAIIETEFADLADIAPTARGPVLVLDAIQDPGNVGALLRTAWALGAAGAIALEGTADVASPKVSRAAMGATFRFPIATAAMGEFIQWVRRHEVRLWVADTAGKPLTRLAIPKKLAVVVGNEGAGVRPDFATEAHDRVAIPLASGVESLNVVVAAGIVLHQVMHA
jgi:TrmH family RNA methyltransferase